MRGERRHEEEKEKKKVLRRVSKEWDTIGDVRHKGIKRKHYII